MWSWFVPVSAGLTVLASLVGVMTDPDGTQGELTRGFLLYGGVIALGGFVVNGAAGMWAGSVGQRVARGSPALDYITAGLFAALAMRLAILERA